MSDFSTIHASAVLVGAKAILIRGPSGAGKSNTAWELIQAATDGRLPFARLVADDRAYLEIHSKRLIVRPAETLAGLIEIRGLGIRQIPYEPMALVGAVLDLGEKEAMRHPDPDATIATIKGIKLPRLGIVVHASSLSLILAFLTTSAAGN